MGKLLPTRLPQAQGTDVSVDTFNRLVRILELNLGAEDPDVVRSLGISTNTRHTLLGCLQQRV